MIEISSRTNARVQNLLQREREFWFFEGDKLVRDVRAKNIALDILIIDRESVERGQGNRLEAENTGLANETWLVSHSVMAKLSQLKDIPAEIAVVRSSQRPIDLSVKTPIMILDSIQDPGNVGTIIRAAVAFGFQRVALCGESAKPHNRKLLRAAQTAIFDIAWDSPASAVQFAMQARHAGFNIYTTAATADGRAIAIDAVQAPAAIVFGNEGHGVAAELLAEFPPIRIAQSHMIESLNVAVSASIMMYELSKRGDFTRFA